jgi:glycosyltransferase involved in cell wall biosynthesis
LNGSFEEFFRELETNGLATQPLVSIVTPCYNAGRFLEETVQSVLAQDYPDIEYLVMDGGSTDGSLEILERCRHRLQYVSAPDRGQADAVNRGFQLSHGSISAFLNADDTYLPGAISQAVRCLVDHPEAGVVYGEAYHVSETGEIIGRYPTSPFDPERFRYQCYICQPAAFMRREAFQAVGMLDTDLHFALDYDLWIRLARHYSMLKIDPYLAHSRMYPENKTLGQLRQVFQEVLLVLRRHYDFIPSNWLYGYSDYLITGKHSVFAAPRPSVFNLVLCLALGIRSNWRHPLWYGKDLFQSAARIRACQIPW